MKSLKLFILTIFVTLSNFAFADICGTDALTGLQHCQQGQVDRYIAGLDTFRKYHSGNGVSYNEYNNSSHLEIEQMYSSLSNMDIHLNPVTHDFWTNKLYYNYGSGNQFSAWGNSSLPVNTPYVQLPEQALVNTNGAATIHVIFTFSAQSLYFNDIPPANIGNIFSLELWGYNSQNQNVLIAQRFITGNDLDCESHVDIGLKEINGNLGHVYAQTCESKGTNNSISPDDYPWPGKNPPLQFLSAIKIDSELLQASVNESYKNLSAKFIPVNLGLPYQQVEGNDGIPVITPGIAPYEIFPYNIELDIFQ